MRKSIFLAAALLLAPTVSQAKTLEDLLVEKGVITKGEAKSAKAGSVGTTSYSNKGTRFDFPSDGFTTGFNVFMQESYTYTDVDNDSDGVNTSSFDINKARLYVWGTALNEEFSYLLNGDFVGETNGDGEDSPSLKDAFVKWHACDNGWVRMGQFKTGLGRQFNNSDHKLMFASRSVASDFFDLDRQGGADGQWTFADGQLVVGAGIFNGDSDGEGINQGGKDTNHTGVVNARFNVMGSMDSYSEGDLDWSEDAALSIGGAFASGEAKNDLGGGLEDVDTNTISADVNLKYMGFALNAEYFFASADRDNVSDDIEPTGFYAQVGYFIDPKTVEIAAGYSLVDCDLEDDGSSACGDGLDEKSEWKGGVNYYWWGHNLKAQLNYVRSTEDFGSDDTSDNKWLLQLTQYL